MPNNNPDGYNAFGGPMEREMPYGDLKKRQALTSLAPTSMPSPSPIEAPRRAQRRATRGKEQAGAVVGPTPVVSPQPSQGAMSSFWAALAAEPGVSPLILELAQEAQRGS